MGFPIVLGRNRLLRGLPLKCRQRNLILEAARVCLFILFLYISTLLSNVLSLTEQVIVVYVFLLCSIVTLFYLECSIYFYFAFELAF